MAPAEGVGASRLAVFVTARSPIKANGSEEGYTRKELLYPLRSLVLWSGGRRTKRKEVVSQHFSIEWRMGAGSGFSIRTPQKTGLKMDLRSTEVECVGSRDAMSLQKLCALFREPAALALGNA